MTQPPFLLQPRPISYIKQRTYSPFSEEKAALTPSYSLVIVNEAWEVFSHA